MEGHEVSDLLDARRRRGVAYFEFLRVPSMSCGVYVLPKGGPDPQSPHQEDEVYHIVQGRAWLRVGQEDRQVRPGSLVYVPARVEHRFHGIEEDLAALVFFASAESSASE